MQKRSFLSREGGVLGAVSTRADAPDEMVSMLG